MESRSIFTSRIDGVSAPPFAERNLALHVGDDPVAVRQNRHQLAVHLGIDPSRLFFMDQVHGVDVLEINESSDASQPRQCDAMITRTPGTGLAVLVADCAPVIIHGERSSAVIHVGWRGLLGGIIEKVIDLMGQERFTASIGPTICGRCYEVGDDVLIPARERGCVVNENRLDIPASILALLSATAGERMIDGKWSGVCTLESSEHFSYRRDKVTGRQVGVVVHGSQK